MWQVTHRPGQRAQRTHALQVVRAKGRQVRGNPELKDEEPPAYHAVRPRQQRDLHQSKQRLHASHVYHFT